ALPVVRAHVLAPLAASAAAPWVVESRHADDGLLVTITGCGFTDTLWCATGGSGRGVATGLIAFTGELMHARADAAGELRQCVAVQASRLDWHGAAQLETEAPVDRVIVVTPPSRATRTPEPVLTSERG